MKFLYINLSKNITRHQKIQAFKQRGFSLIELVVGIVVMAIALSFLTNIFFSNAGRSVEPMLQIRAAEFGQSLMEEIVVKRFDETTPLGGMPACSTATVACSDSSTPNWWNDGESRTEFDDVDDYNLYCDNSAPYQPIINTSGENLSAVGERFQNYSMSVCVGYDGNFNGVLNEGGSDQNAKLIIIDIYPSSGAGLGNSAITFRAYRANY